MKKNSEPLFGSSEPVTETFNVPQRIWFNQYSKLPPKDHGEVNTLPSLTIPEQSMTVMELMQRHSAGLPLTGHRIPIFEGEDTMPDLEKLDLSERYALMEKAQKEFNELKQKQLEKRKQKTLSPYDTLKQQLEELRSSIVNPDTNKTPLPVKGAALSAGAGPV